MKLLQTVRFAIASISIVLLIADSSVCCRTAKKIRVFSTPRFRMAVIPKYPKVRFCLRITNNILTFFLRARSCSIRWFEHFAFLVHQINLSKRYVSLIVCSVFFIPAKFICFTQTVGCVFTSYLTL